MVPYCAYLSMYQYIMQPWERQSWREADESRSGVRRTARITAWCRVPSASTAYACRSWTESGNNRSGVRHLARLLARRRVLSGIEFQRIPWKSMISLFLYDYTISVSTPVATFTSNFNSSFCSLSLTLSVCLPLYCPTSTTNSTFISTFTSTSTFNSMSPSQAD